MNQKYHEGFKITCGAARNDSVIVAGDKFNPVILDLSKGLVRWAGKNVSHDWLDLQVKNSDRCVLLDKSDPSLSCFFTGDNNGYIRKYDIRAKKKPILQTSIFELGAVKDTDEIVTCIDQSRDNYDYLGIGGNRGSVLILDQRKISTLSMVEKTKPVKCRNSEAIVRALKPSDGGINSVKFGNIRKFIETPKIEKSYSTGATIEQYQGYEGFIAACGNDRKLRVNEVSNGKEVNLIYLKSKLTKMLVSEDIDFNKRRKQEMIFSQKEQPKVKKESVEVPVKKAKVESAGVNSMRAIMGFAPKTEAAEPTAEPKNTESSDDLWKELEEAAGLDKDS